MKELKDVLGMVADVLKSFAEGMGTIAGKVDALAQAHGTTEMEPDEPKPKTAEPNKAEKVKKPVLREKKPVTKPAVKKPLKKAALKAAREKKEVVKTSAKKTILKPALEKKESITGKKANSTASDMVLQFVSDATNGIETGSIMEKTGFDKKKVSNIVHRLKQQGKIESARRGIYTKKG